MAFDSTDPMSDNTEPSIHSIRMTACDVSRSCRTVKIPIDRLFMNLFIDVLIAKVVVIVGFRIVEASLPMRTAGGSVTWSVRIEIKMKVSSTFSSRSGGSVGGVILWPKHLTGNIIATSTV